MLDLDYIIEVCDIAMLFEHLGIEYERRNSTRGMELYFKCLNPDHEDNSASCSISEVGKYKGLFNCWSCSAKGSIYHLLQWHKKIPFVQAAHFLSNFVGGGQMSSTDQLLYKLSKFKGENIESNPIGVVDWEFKLPINSFRHCCNDPHAKVGEDYLFLRGISEVTQRFFDCRTIYHDQIGWSVMVPICYGHLVRSVFYCQPKFGGMKRYPSGSKIGYLMFNYDNVTDMCIIVESILDVLRLHSLGIMCGVACFTNNISPTQLDHIKNCERIIVFPDMDSAQGWVLVDRVVKKFGTGVELILPPHGKDPGDCTDEEILDAFKNITTYGDWQINQFIQQHVDVPCKVIDVIKCSGNK